VNILREFGKEVSLESLLVSYFIIDNIDEWLAKIVSFVISVKSFCNVKLHKNLRTEKCSIVFVSNEIKSV